MSTPKRASRKTTTTAKSPTKKPATAKPRSAKKSLKKTAAKKTAAKKVVKKAAVKKTATKKTATKKTTAQKVAKKVAKIISKVVAKKKAAKKAAKAGTTVAKVAPNVKKAAKTVAKKKAAPAVKSATAATKKTAAAKTTVARRPKSFATRNVEHSYGFPAHTPELPDTYGEDRLVLMTKDPEYLFAYWEVTPEKKAEGEKAKRRGERYREALRLNWAARDIFERNFALLPVSHAARKWYLRVPFSGLSYQVEIGWLGESGHFVSLLASNPSDAPESWTATRRRLKHVAAGDVLGRALTHGRPSGSSGLSAGAAGEENNVPDWDFPGPGAQSSSSLSVGNSKTARRPAR